MRMSMADQLLRLLGILGFIASLAILAWYVPEVDLLAVIVLVCAMAVYDVLIRPRLVRNSRMKKKA
jgi:hypothetical protein